MHVYIFKCTVTFKEIQIKKNEQIITFEKLHPVFIYLFILIHLFAILASNKEYNDWLLHIVKWMTNLLVVRNMTHCIWETCTLLDLGLNSNITFLINTFLYWSKFKSGKSFYYGWEMCRVLFNNRHKGTTDFPFPPSLSSWTCTLYPQRKAKLQGERAANGDGMVKWGGKSKRSAGPC